MVRNIYSYNKGIANMLQEYKTISKQSGSDVGKHQYMSCKSGQAGIGGVVAALTVGAAKESYDFARKSTSSIHRENYKGVSGIIEDGVKDMKNNVIGSFYGLTHPQNGSCDSLLKKKGK